ncbi:heme lyase CcmF/NrfE family subunit [Archaeoglobus neptunius]|uniref:heme lyase CcmF/NrfE family subunit n=1 Tax=Archaeoglobus neptunius TaxID=2798580 RepID=UPI0019281761|nr:heme lyase CcmF/NrfE family subunit [Archaeoglobus neptunius]
MAIEAGSLLLYSALVSSAYTIISFYESALKADTNLNKAPVRLTAIILTVSLLTLGYYFLTDNFTIEYVYSHSTSELPVHYKISAIWAGSEGSFLLWTWIFSVMLLIFTELERPDRLTTQSALILAMLLSVMVFFTMAFQNPFKIIESNPPHGLGLNPLLETHEMLFHPPVLFTGYAAAAFPFALSISGLYLLDDRWILRARKWALISWLFLTAGILLGGFWSYRILGWGGFWAWDPVENASLLPWLTLTAFLHSIMIQEARGGMKIWNFLLALTSFEFVLLGTLITRSGVITSIHAFAESTISIPITLLMTGTFVFSLLLLHRRIGEIQSFDVIESAVSKEASFLLNNLLLTAFALIVFWGTIFPIFTEAFLGYRSSIGEKYYLQTVSPVAFSLVALIGFCAGLQWRKSDRKRLKILSTVFIVVSAASLIAGYLTKMGAIDFIALTFALFSLALQGYQYIRDAIVFKREYGNLSFIKILILKRRRYGGYLVHLGAIIVFLGVVGNWGYSHEQILELRKDQPVEFYGYQLIYRGYNFENTSNKVVAFSDVEVVKDGISALIQPRIEYYVVQGQVIRKPGISRYPLVDIYVIIEKLGKEKGIFKVKINPLTSFIWNGSVLMIAGGLVSLTPRRIVAKVKGGG